MLSIDLQGYPILNGYCFMDAEFVFKEEQNFIKCCTDGKYGLINKYRYLCIPCEYDSIILKKERSEDCFYAELKKGNIDYTAIIEGDSICNIISSIKPNFIKLYENFLIIEEQTTKDGKVFSKQGLLNRGGIRILKSEYDSIDIVSKCFITAQEKKYHSSIYDSIANVSSIFAIVSKDDIKQLLFITETDFTVIIDYSEEIVYGEGVNEYDGMKYYYASINNNTIRIFMSLKQQGGFCAFKDECIRSYECDKIYFSYNGIPNNYFAVVESDKTKLINRYFDEIIPPVIPSKYLVKTDSYSEGIVAIYIMKQEKTD